MPYLKRISIHEQFFYKLTYCGIHNCFNYDYKTVETFKFAVKKAFGIEYKKQSFLI